MEQPDWLVAGGGGLGCGFEALLYKQKVAIMTKSDMTAKLLFH